MGVAAEVWARPVVQGNDMDGVALHAAHCQAEMSFCIQRSDANNTRVPGEIGFEIGLLLAPFS